MATSKPRSEAGTVIDHLPPAGSSPEIAELSDIIDELAVEADIDPVAWDKFRVITEPLKGHSQFHYAHSLRVGIYAYGIARFEGQPDLHLPLFGGFGHDIGKVTIDKALLETTGSFTNEQWRQVSAHAEAGFDILRERGFPFTAFIAGAHHLYQEEPYGIQLATQELLADPVDLAHVRSVAELVALSDQFDSMSTRNNDRNRVMGQGEAAQRAELLAHFPSSEERLNWLFDHKLGAPTQSS